MSDLKTDDIVEGLAPDQQVRLISVRQMAGNFALEGIGMTTNSRFSRVLTAAQAAELTIVGQKGKVNFDGDPTGFKLWIEARRIQTAFQFDPLFAVNCSIVDPLPHQVETVYSYLLPLPTIRFLLADDTGAGKTIMTGLLLHYLHFSTASAEKRYWFHTNVVSSKKAGRWPGFFGGSVVVRRGVSGGRRGGAIGRCRR